MKLLFACGGTGGHIVPGRNLAKWFHSRSKDHEARFLTAGRELEDRFFEQTDWVRVPLFPGFKSRPSLRSPIPWLRAAHRARRQVRSFRPDALILAGGYVCLPALLAWPGSGARLYILEQNASPGKVTRLAAPFAHRIFSHFERAWRGSRDKVSPLGSPLPPGFGEGDGLSRESLRRDFGLKPSVTTLLVAGGSQGARAVNDFIVGNLGLLDRLPAGELQVLHVAGARDEGRVRERYRGFSHPAVVLPFVDPMEKAYQASDLILCRGGGMTLAEVAALGLPALVIPYPHHKDRHQYHNAAEMVERGGGLILDEREATPERFQECLVSLLLDKDRLKRMGERARLAGKPDSGRRIMEQVMEDHRNRKD